VLGEIERMLERPGALLEGPRLTADGAVLYSDVIGGGVYRDGDLVVPKRRGVGGLVPHREGGVVVTGPTVQHGERVLLASDDLTGFNDLTTTPDGDLLVGALRFHPFKGEEPVPGALLHLRAPGDAAVLDEAVLWPNGIGLSPGGDRLYMCDYARAHVVTMGIDGGGRATFAESPRGSADGLAVDVEGGVWVALGDAGAVARFDPDGDLAAVVDIPADFVSSISFRGTDVLITAVGALFRARSEVAGVPVADARI
jgi:sugar lactone lactonase YvrE